MPSTNTDRHAADAADLYFTSLAGVRILPAEVQRDLAIRVQERGDKIALGRLVESNLRLAASLAWRHRRDDLDVMDLVAEANIGLLLAVAHFDTSRRIPFPSYARYWMRARILAWLHAHRQIVSLGSRAARRLVWGLERARRDLARDGLPVDAEHLAARLDLRVEDVRELLPLLDQRATSLDVPASAESSGTLIDQLADETEPGPEQNAARHEIARLRADVLDAFGATLDARDRAIWEQRLRTERPEALNALGDRFGISKERVRQLELRLKERLRDFVSERLAPETLAVVLN